MKNLKTIIAIIGVSLILFYCDNSVNTKQMKIGTQTWAVKNLDVTIFRNGNAIQEAKTNEDWEKAGNSGKPAWCYYGNNPDNNKKYGKLYNWFAVNDPRGLAPEGWHVASDAEWTQLITFLGGENNASTKMKSTSGWEVIDLGVDVGTEKFLKALDEDPGAVIGLSALLTTTMENMKKTVTAIKGKHSGSKILIGGAPVTKEYCEKIGADFYSPDPQGAVNYLKNLAS